MNDDDIATIGARLRAAWAAIIDTERHRGDAPGGDAQEAYQAALLLFRHAQIEAFTITLGAIPLLQAQVDALEARVAALEGRP